MRKLILFTIVIISFALTTLSFVDYSSIETGNRFLQRIGTSNSVEIFFPPTPEPPPVPAQGYYALEDNMLDSSGNSRHGSAVGSGPTYDTTLPLPVRDTYFAKLAAGNAISIPTTVFTASMANTGTIKATFYIHPQISVTTEMVVYGDFGANGVLYTSFNANKVFVSIPTTTGSQTFDSGVAVLELAKWYELYITYASDVLQVYLKDLSADSAALVIDEILPASEAEFSGCTDLLIGNYRPDLATWPYTAGIDNVGYFDTVITSDGRSDIPQYCVMHLGHSTVRGTIPNLGCREGGHAYFMSNSMYFNFNGDLFYGSGIAKMHSGVNSDTTALINARTDAALDKVFPQTGTNQIIWLGPVMANDCHLYTNTATSKANLESIVDKIDAHGSDIKIFLITDNDKTTVPTNIEDYNDLVRDVYSEKLIEGKNVYLMDLYTQNIPLADGVHPTPEGYVQMGEYLAGTTKSLLGL